MSVVLFYAAATDFDCHSLFDTFEKDDFGYIYKRLMSGNVGTMVYIGFHSRHVSCTLLQCCWETVQMRSGPPNYKISQLVIMHTALQPIWFETRNILVLNQRRSVFNW